MSFPLIYLLANLFADSSANTAIPVLSHRTAVMVPPLFGWHDGIY
ncbi:hypothetical protein [Halopseudomonas sp.]